MFHPVITWDGNINYDNLSLSLSLSCLDFPITLGYWVIIIITIIARFSLLQR